MAKLFLRVVVTALFLAGCGPPGRSKVPVLPRTAAGWTLEADAAACSELIPSARAAWRARYRGAPPVVLTVYEMPSETNGFDALQKWRPSTGRMAFYQGRYFAIAEAPGADFRTLNTFIAAVRGGMASPA